MEFFGMLLFFVGASGLDTQGKMWYVAAALTIGGLVIAYVSQRKPKTVDKIKHKRYD